ncbi:alanine racemase [Streptomyces sp. NPDC019531]|uniref:alanine racemase n=1 Tax=Streptomyces sp. NPDC019531 TaxID=3365062 RepID=UPI00384D8DFE
MTLTLSIDTSRWREHQESILRQFPELVPVCKGNGYGFGQQRVAQETARLGVRLLAVGTPYEAAQIQDIFSRDVLILTPYRRGEESVPLSHRIIRTVASVEGARDLAGTRTVVKLMSSMRRHGVTEQDLPALSAAVKNLRCAGFSLHLPLNRANTSDAMAEVITWIDCLRSAGLSPRTFFVSHLGVDELARLRQQFLDTDFRLRVGTRLWLGGHQVAEYRSTVLNVVRVVAGERFGELQRRAVSDGHLVVVAGGTSHGIGLRAPRTLRGVLPRVRHMTGAGRAAVNRHLFPFFYAGERCRFAEPPHMHESVLFVPAEQPPPRVGESLVARVRYTTTRPDRVVERSSPVYPSGLPAQR